MRGWIGCTRAGLGERGGSKEFGEPRNPYSLLNFNQEFRLGELNPKFVLLYVIVWFWWNYALKFVMHMKEFGGCEFSTVLFEFWTKCMKERGLYTVYTGMVWNLEFGNFMEFILCLCVVAMCVNWFGMNRNVFWYVCALFRVNCAREQTRNPASLAQASPSRLSESCRVSFFVLVRVSRLGDHGRGWATQSLAQARDIRPSEVTRKPGERFWGPERRVCSLRREWLA